MSITKNYYKKNLRKYLKNDKYKILNFSYKKYFLLCENCLWMASTISALKDISMIQYKRCPVCINKQVNRFLICCEN